MPDLTTTKHLLIARLNSIKEGSAASHWEERLIEFALQTREDFAAIVHSVELGQVKQIAQRGLKQFDDLGLFQEEPAAPEAQDEET